MGWVKIFSELLFLVLMEPPIFSDDPNPYRMKYILKHK